MIHLDGTPKGRAILFFGAPAVLAGWLCGCATPADQGAWLVSKPNMQFSEARVFNAPIRIGSQLEPGRVVSGGAQPSVCTSCR